MNKIFVVAVIVAVVISSIGFFITQSNEDIKITIPQKETIYFPNGTSQTAEMVDGVMIIKEVAG